MESYMSIIDQITSYIKSNGNHKFNINPESKFRFNNIEECIKAFTIFSKSEKILRFQESFYNNPIDFVKNTGLLEVPSNIEIIRNCKYSYKKDHPNKCFECRFDVNGNVSTIMVVCMNRDVYERLFNILTESELPKRILFSNEVNIRTEPKIDMIKESAYVSAANAEETGVVVNIYVINDITVIEIPSIL